MKQVLVSGKGELVVMDVPVPMAVPDSVLVRNEFSVISAGTEGAAVASRPGWIGALEKARKSPGRIERVWEMARTQGIATTWEVVRAKLGEVTPIGYSCAGRVVEIRGDVPFSVGDRVACMGTGYANHAEFVTVPRNLSVRIPDGVASSEAAFAALACIAMHGIRRLDLGPGTSVGVIGLGLIGQITVRLLRAMGYEAVGFDLDEGRTQHARFVDGVEAWTISANEGVERVKELTSGRGLDGVIVSAASTGSEAANLALDLSAHRGRVVILGDVGMDLMRHKMYRKELEVRLSCSYGPGRYDPHYEEGGNDYPAGYVRWTERRNLEWFLQLLASKRLDLSSLISERFPIEEAPRAYSRIKAGDSKVFGILFEYPSVERPLARTIERPVSRTIGDVKIRLGLIGTGSHTRAVHVPNLGRLASDFSITAVASRAGASAALVGRTVSAGLVTSDYRELLARTDVDAVLIATRHSSHASIVLDALAAGKHVFIEKPMATTVEDAKAIVDKVRETSLVLRVGFNRRFAPMLVAMRTGFSDARRMLSVRVNAAGVVDHWSSAAEEGGRLMGEGVHFFDFCNWFMGAEPTSITARTAGEPSVDNADTSTLLSYPDGSVATVIYATGGHRELGKENFEVIGGGQAARCDNYIKLEIFGAAKRRMTKPRGDKGQLAVLKGFATAIRGQEDGGANARAGLVATRLAVAAYESASLGSTVDLDV